MSLRGGAFLTGLLALALLASLAFGEVRLAPAEILRVFAGGGEELSRTVILDFRLPRALVAMAVGAALACSGVLMQSFFRNPLASPGLLGVSSGGALGAVLAFAFGWASTSMWALPLASIAGAFLATLAVLAIAREGASTEHLLLAGVAMNALFGAATSFVLTLKAGHFEVGGQILFWLMGGLESRTWEHVGISLPGVALACLLVLPSARALNLLAMGELGAQSLGVNVRRLRWELVILSTILTALASAVGGVVGFVGLIVPHLLRLGFGPDHRRLLPLSMLGGAAFVLVCDLVARTVPGQLRLGVVTALAGGPFFLWMLRRRA